MGFNIGSIVKGVVSGVETLAETANPVLAAGAGAAALLGSGSPGAASSPLQTFDPLLDEMSGSLNPGSPPQLYSYNQLAGVDGNGNSTSGQHQSPADLVD